MQPLFKGKQLVIIHPKDFPPCMEAVVCHQHNHNVKIVTHSLPLLPTVSWTSFSLHLARIFFEATAVQNPLSSHFQTRCCICHLNSSKSENLTSQNNLLTQYFRICTCCPIRWQVLRLTFANLFCSSVLKGRISTWNAVIKWFRS